MKTIKKEASYEDILRKIPEDKKTIGEKLITELSFMEKTLEKLRATIDEKGEVEHFQQGKQDFLRER